MNQDYQLIFDSRSGQTPPPAYNTIMQAQSWNNIPQGSFKSLVNSGPTTPDSFEGPYFSLDLRSQQAPMQGDNTMTSTGEENGYYHSRRGSDSGSSFDGSLYFPPSSTTAAAAAAATQALHNQPTTVLLSQHQHMGLAEHHHLQSNQPIPHHLHPGISNSGPLRMNQLYGASIFPTYARQPTMNQINHLAALRASSSPAAGFPDWNTFSAIADPQQALAAIHRHQMGYGGAMPPHAMKNNGLDFSDPYIHLAIRQYAAEAQLVADGGSIMSPPMNIGGHQHQTTGLSMGMSMSMGPPSSASAMAGRALSSRSSSTSTPSLACTSPQTIMSPPPPPSSTSSSTSMTQSDFALFRTPSDSSGMHSRLVSEDIGNGINAPVPEPIRKPKTKGKAKQRKAPGPVAETSSSGQSPPAPIVSTASFAPAASIATVNKVPLSTRVADLPEKKRRMFEQACGDLWRSLSSSDSNTTAGMTKEEQEAARKQLEEDTKLVEDFVALIGSEELANQDEVPDSLVRPVLKAMALPKASEKKGSRGGAAGYHCQWAGCSKELIKRLDHAKNHVREHCKSKPHTCGGGGSSGSKGCGGKFLRMDDLKRHQKSHCSVLKPSSGRRPRSVRGVHGSRDSDEEDEEDDDYEETASVLSAASDASYVPGPKSSGYSSMSATRRLATRLQKERRRVIREPSSDLSMEEDSDDLRVVDSGRLETSNVRGAPLTTTTTTTTNDGDDSQEEGNGNGPEKNGDEIKSRP